MTDLPATLQAQAANYRTLGYSNDDTLFALLEVCAQHWPDKPAIVWGEQSMTFAQWHDRSLRLASALRRLGVEKTDRVAVQLPNTPQFLIAFLAIAACGAVTQTIHMPYREAELRPLLSHSGAKCVICVADHNGYSPAVECVKLCAELPDLAHAISVGKKPPGALAFEELVAAEPAQHLPPLDGGDQFLLLYTSGTTGNPKGVPVRYYQFMSNARIAVQDWGLRHEDVILSAAPFTHLYGLWTIILTLYQGATNALLAVFTPPALIETIGALRPNGIFAVPAHIAALLQLGLWDSLDPSGIRFICQAGSIVPQRIAEAIDDKLAEGTVLQLFGMSELQAGAYTRPGDSRATRVGTSGACPDGMELQVVDDDDAPVAQGEEGHLLIRGIAVFSGYWNNETATAEAFTENGWFRTGDTARLDAEGKLIITGRSKEVINRGGIKYHPAEVEQVVDRLPEVTASAIVPYSDEVLGERACIFVEPVPGAQVTLNDIANALQDAGLAKFKWPERLELVDAMPLTPTRKIIRGRLQERVEGQG